MTDPNPFDASTPAVVPDMSPEELVFGAAPLPVFVPPSVVDPVSNLDFPPVDDAFALEMRSGTIEQLVGGDALRRGESERIEAGRSEANADRVAGRDRVRVQGTLHEHAGHGLVEQTAHLHTTVDGALDVHAGSEDTVLLAGHMCDLWNGGAAIVAAMTDDTVGGDGIRVTTPLDLWVHGLMGVEERIGTCTADAVLMEFGATHYEREYGPGVHAAGLAVYTGSLYQSNRSTFRPLMRVSSGVRNLIAGGGGGGGDAGEGGAPAASPPPAAGGAETRAASKTLCAATSAGGTAQAGAMAGVRSEDLTGVHRVDEVAAPAGGAHVAGASGDLTELRRGEDTAGQLAALRDAMRGAETDAQREVTSVSRVSELDDTASVHEASALDIVGDIRSGATVPGMDAPVLQSAVSPPQPPPGVKLGLLGGGNDPIRPASIGYEQWKSFYTRLRTEFERHRNNSNWIATRAFADAISDINAKMLEAYVESGGSIDALDSLVWDDAVPLAAYRTLRDLAREAGRAGDTNRAGGIEQLLASIDRLTVEFIDVLDARTDELDRAYVEARRMLSLTPRNDVRKVNDVIEELIEAGKRRLTDAESRNDTETIAMACQELRFLLWAQADANEGRDPRVASYNRIRSNAETGRASQICHVEADKPWHARLTEAMADRSIHWPAVQGPEAGGTTPPPLPTVDSGAAGRLGEVPPVPGPSSSATAGTDAGELGRGMLEQPVVGSADEAHPGTAAPRSGVAQAMVTPELGAQATFWLRPVDPVPAPGTVRFDAGFHRAGQQPQHSGEAAIGGTAVHRPFVPTPEEMLDPIDVTVRSSWSAEAFEAERALIAGRTPPYFDSTRFVRQWCGLAEKLEIEDLRQSAVPGPRGIDSIIERLRAMEGGRGHPLHIQQLETLKQRIHRTLTDAYGYRAEADWLDRVDKFLNTGSAAQAVGVEPISVPSRGEGIVGGAQISLQQLRIESAAPPGPTKGGAGELSPGALSMEEDPWGSPWSEVGSNAGELSPGALSPAQDPLSPRPQVRFGEVEMVGFDATQPVSSLGAGGRGVAVGPTAGWQAAEAPGFGRLASIPAELAFSRREQIVHRLMTGEALSAAQRADLLGRYERAIGAGTIASPVPRARTAAALLEDLRRLSTAARVSPASALLSPALEDIDWAAIELMLWLFDAPGL